MSTEGFHEVWLDEVLPSGDRVEVVAGDGACGCCGDRVRAVTVTIPAEWVAAVGDRVTVWVPPEDAAVIGGRIIQAGLRLKAVGPRCEGTA